MVRSETVALSKSVLNHTYVVGVAMNRLFLILTIVVSCTSLLPAQQSAWQWVNPTPQGNPLNGVWTVNSDTVISVGANGTILRTFNGGTTWQVQNSIDGIVDQLYAVKFLNPTTGWVVGEFGDMVKTTDGGESWDILNGPTEQDLFAVDFASTTTGWAVGLGGTIIKTTDGGSSWVPESSTTTETLYGCAFTSATNGFAVGTNGVIVATTNGGSTWVPKTSGTGQSLYGVYFLSSTTGYAVGSFGTILRTINGGTTWTPLVSGSDVSLFGIQFTSALTGWTFGSYGTILKTTNGGSTWFPENSNSYNDLFGMRFATASIGYVVGDLGVMLSTSDGGTTWIPQSSSTKDNLLGIDFVSSTTGWSVGQEGTIVETTDGGLTWDPQPSGVYQDLYGVSMISNAVGWAVGDSAVIVKTSNGGLTWTEQNSHTDPTLYSASFVNGTTGWAVGDFGTILKTSNGTTWSAETSHTITTLQEVMFANANVGWAIGYSGVIMKTTNGGSTWVQQTTPTTNALNGLTIIDLNTVFVVGDFGTMLKTTNGGTTWNQIPADPSTFLYSVTFANATNGWIVGDGGVIMKTTDGGITWSSQYSPTGNTLWSIEYVPLGSGGLLYVAGSGGTILCSAVYPVSARTWTGAVDSLWTSAANWNPAGVPGKFDSVYIPTTAKNPVLLSTVQQINLAALRIGSDAKLSIGSGLAQIVVKGNINIDGTLQLGTGSTLEILAGGNFLVNPAGAFNAERSTIVLTSQGSVKGNFYNLYLSAGTSVQSLGNISVTKTLTLLSNLIVRPSDTVSVLNIDPQAIQGNGILTAGTVKRSIQTGSTFGYRFESPVTYLGFYPTGTAPNTVTMTVKPNSLPAGFSDTNFVRRTYYVSASGGSNYIAFISLRYDSTETSLPIDNLGLFRDSSGLLVNMGNSDFLDSDLVAISLDTLTTFSTMYIGRLDYTPPNSLQFRDTITVTDHGGLFGSVSFGADPTATTGIDTSLGEIGLGPKPAAGNFDIRWTVPPSQGTHVDILPIIGPTNTTNVYILSIQPGAGGYPMTLQWQTGQLPPGLVILEDQATQGSQFKVDMKSQNSFTISNSSISAVRIVYQASTTYAFSQNWNITSLPLVTTMAPVRSALFPNAISDLFGFSTSYFITDTMKTGRGYWIKFALPDTVPIGGLPFTKDTVQLVAGWNLIGAVSSAAAVRSITQNPSGIVVSNYFGYNAAYSITDSLRPSRGYWVKASGSGSIVITGTGSTSIPKKAVTEKPADDLAKFNSVTISDRTGGAQTLYFTDTAPTGMSPDMSSLPPIPPAGVFDARFTSGQFLEILQGTASRLSIAVQSDAYPITLKWKILEPSLKSLTFADAATHLSIPQTRTGQEGTARISDPSTKVISLLAERGSAIPKSFALVQNFPNPFNPSTTIQFDLPVASEVSLKVYNLLGQEVETLLNSRRYEAGTFSSVFDAQQFASGVYFYRIDAQGIAGPQTSFHEIKKMIIMK